MRCLYYFLKNEKIEPVKQSNLQSESQSVSHLGSHLGSHPEIKHSNYYISSNRYYVKIPTNTQFK